MRLLVPAALLLAVIFVSALHADQALADDGRALTNASYAHNVSVLVGTPDLGDDDMSEISEGEEINPRYGSATFDNSTNTISLANANLTSLEIEALDKAADVTIALVGKNSISENLTMPFWSQTVNLKITGPGSLSIGAYEGDESIFCTGDITFQSGSVSTDGSIYANGTLIVSGGSLKCGDMLSPDLVKLKKGTLTVNGPDSINCDLKRTGGKLAYVKEVVIKYHLNGGKFPKGASYGDYLEQITYSVAKGKSKKLSTAILPYRLGYVFVGWYKNKELTKAVTKVRASSPDVYAKWKRISGKPYYVRAFNDKKYSGTAADVANVNKCMKALKKKWLKDFAERGCTIRVCSNAHFNRFIDRFHDAAGYFSDASLTMTDGWGSGAAGIVLRSGSGTTPRLVCHEFGHWYEWQYVSKKNVKKLAKLHKRYKKQINAILGSHAAEDQGEGFAETFSAIMTHSLSKGQKSQLGSFYKLVDKLIK